MGLALGVVGLGRIGALHVQTLLALEHVSSVTVADVDADRARQVAAELSVDAVESAEALVDADIDALVIATATPGHVPMLNLAAAARLPAFCEKPVALDLHTLDGVRADVEATGILVQVGFQRTPATGPPTQQSWTAGSADCSSYARRRTIPFHRHRTTSPLPVASSPTCTFTTSTQSAS